MFNLEEYIKEPIPYKKYLDKYFSKNDGLTIFDVGACEGEDSIKFSDSYPSSKIYCFEPLPKNIKKIDENIKKYQKRNIFKQHLALSDKEGEANFYVSSGQPGNVNISDVWDYGNKSSSLLEPHKVMERHPWLKFESEIQVTTTTIKEFCLKNSITKIDIIHLDVQGAELKVLKGAQEILKNVSLIWLEVENIPLYKDQPLKRDIETFLGRSGFLKKMDTVGKITGDQLYINKKLINPFFRLLYEVFKR